MFNACEPFQGLDKDRKGGESKRGKRDSCRDEELDPDGMDWWTKYHASMDTMVRVCLDLFISQDLILFRLILLFSFCQNGATFLV